MSRADRCARDIIDRLQPDYPVDVDSVAQTLGVAIQRQELEEEVSGILVVKGEHAIIAVNGNHHPHRQRFTIAHELGHFLLHNSESSIFIDATTVFFRDRRSSEGTKWQEIEANAFAAELLVPAAALAETVREQVGEHLLDELDDAVIHRLASQFGVSVQALTIRLVRLGFISESLR